jgi:pilus assembly protein FimV
MKTVTQHSDNQYDDDLTVGMDDHNSFSTNSINLFEFAGDDDSPIARLKTIILSIDWEINDDILQQLKEELLDLNEIWAGDKIKQVYIQGLDKIGKYIFKERAKAHPNAIKLLLTFYSNLGKIVSSEEIMSDQEKKRILLEDVEKFDQLKIQISKSSKFPSAQKTVVSQPSATGVESENVLQALNAQILGLDWEINDQGLQRLSEEVGHLEEIFSQSKAKLVLLQGIGALSSYIKKMRGHSNSNVFALLHSFYGALEKIIFSELSGEEEKNILFTEVTKFNDFKAEIAHEKSESSPVKKAKDSGIDEGKPTLTTQGIGQRFQFNEDPEVSDQDEEESKFFSDVESRLAEVFGDVDEEPALNLTAESALAGVNVETEADDDSDEEALPYEGGTILPALVDAEEESSFSVDRLAKELAVTIENDAQQVRKTEEESTVFSDVESRLAAVLDNIDEEPALSRTDESALAGGNVETEADDDSDEETLSYEDGTIVPALVDAEEESSFSVNRLAKGLAVPIENDAQQTRKTERVLPPGLDVETEVADDSDEKALPMKDGELAPALSGSEEGLNFDKYEKNEVVADTESADLVNRLDSFFGDEIEDSSDDLSLEEEHVLSVAEEVSAGLSFLDEEVPAPAFAETFEPPAAPNVEVTEELSSRLSFLDEEAPAPAFAETSEVPAAPGVEVTEELSSRLSFLDEEVPAPAFAETSEVPAAPDVKVTEELSSRLSFLDEEVPAPAFAETSESPPALNIEVPEEESVGEALFTERSCPSVVGEIDEQLVKE